MMHYNMYYDTLSSTLPLTLSFPNRQIKYMDKLLINMYRESFNKSKNFKTTNV